MTTGAYVHGYSEREKERLGDQANALADLLHHDTVYPAGSRVLEAGCGVGAQTVILAAHSPRAHFTSIDISPQSVEQARIALAPTGATNVTFQVADIRKLPFDPGTFDHVFVCFTLEHLTDPLGALRSLRQMLKPGGTVTAIEGDHGSAYFHPDSRFARRAIQCLVDLQAKAGGDSLIGRRLYPLLTTTGFAEVVVSPRMVYADSSRPELVEGFTRNTFTAMVEGVRERALAAGLMSAADWEQGIRDLYRTAESDGTFCYTFFKARGIRR
ncbi:MAG TPA: methyltransferase domain-containing protein [Phycisphaerae bacterium]|nr:methyltransferase domain-containing protein [Phycisphaerae bacterium]HRY67132.1 methyltransferase domain-containing protein [Phycisphaerae bacterium]HSA26499.1 methyltransferase domain-containing protein [Phycisphaerae bacterium]